MAIKKHTPAQPAKPATGVSAFRFLDDAHNSIESAESLLHICQEALRRQNNDVGAAVAFAIDSAVGDHLQDARAKIIDAMEAVQGVQS
jgi:hypothetical protein